MILFGTWIVTPNIFKAFLNGSYSCCLSQVTRSFYFFNVSSFFNYRKVLYFSNIIGIYIYKYTKKLNKNRYKNITPKLYTG